MRALLAVALASAAAFAAPDAAKEWRTEIKRLERKEKEFWKDAKKRLRDALEVVYRWQRPATSTDNNPHRDYSGFDNLYEDFALIQEAKGKADLALAASGHAKAGATLLKELLAEAKRIDKLEAEILKGRPVHDEAFNQFPSIERHGLARRRDLLVRALAAVPDKHGFLAAALPQAASKDGRRSVVRRVAILDALGIAGGREALETLQPQLQAKETSVRIAAAEACLAVGPPARDALAPVLGDGSPIVRRALVQGIAARAADDPGWIGPVLARYGQSDGVERAECVRALGALTRQTFGDAEATWKEWYADYKPEIDGGRFKKEDIELREAKPAPPQDTLSFYGIATPSRAFVFVVDGSWSLDWPADFDVQLTRFKWDWHRMRQQWEDEHPSHRAVLIREFKTMASAFGKGVRFNILSLHNGFKVDALGKRLLKASPGSIRAAEKHLDSLLGDGWCAQYHGLLDAAELAGVPPESDVDFPEPEADTVFLVTTGDPRGGRYMSAQPLLAAFRRFNRFRRLVVHTVRWCDEGEAAATFLEGIAAASGGTYVWAKKP